MGASNWDTCPKCLAAAQEAHDREAAAIAAAYGQIPVEEFDARRAALVPVDPEKYRTFREDYEFYGASEGEITATYEGRCRTCGLRASLRCVEPFWPTTEAPS